MFVVKEKNVKEHFLINLNDSYIGELKREICTHLYSDIMSVGALYSAYGKFKEEHLGQVYRCLYCIGLSSCNLTE